MSALSEHMPAHMLEFLKKECTGHEDTSSGEMEIDIGSMRHSVMFYLSKILDEEKKRWGQDEELMNASRSTSHSTKREHEDDDIVDRKCYGPNAHKFGDAPHIAADKVLWQAEDSEITRDAVCTAVAPIATEELVETGNSPSNNSSYSGSSNNSGS